MSMADDYRSFRSNDPYRRAAEPAPSSDFSKSNDPLSELARLIGQNDPFADSRRGPSRDPQPRGYQSPLADWPPANADRGYAADSRMSSRESYAPDPRLSGRESYAPDPRTSSRDSYAPDPRVSTRESYAPAAGYQSAPLAPRPPRPDNRWPETQPQYDDGHAAVAAQTAAYADEGMHADQAPEAQDDDQYYYEDEAQLSAEDEAAYDDAPSARRRGGLATALALVGCALLGTAGAYAYRSYSVPNGGKEPPPVITADKSTNKVVPAAANEPKSSKPINERFATAASGNEQLVSRQEEPVALREQGTATAPRVVLPAPVQPAQQTQQAAPAWPTPPAATSQQPTTNGEPKKVRTVTIRPDGDQSGRPVNTNTATTPPAPRATATTPPAPRAPAAKGGGPISLDPQGEPAPRPARTATAPAPRETGSTGGYVVQLSSQKTEGEAQASYRSLQAKFPNELGNQQVIIRRADLGAKGVVYRTNVGPFRSAQEANQFCAQYKAAGGQCIVPTN